MSKSRKKRNVGLLYEFLVRTISTTLVEGDNNKSSKALKIIRHHFKPGTLLYREFRLINSLVKTTVSSATVAASIIQEAKSAARSYDAVELDKQKSLLIRSINHGLNDANFYDQQVNEYKIYSTINTLLGEWRSSDPNIELMAEYEDKLTSWLTSNKEKPVDPTNTDVSPGTSRLLMKVMMQKLNEKYSGTLSDQQKALVRAYAFSTTNSDQNSIRLKLNETRETLLKQIDEYSSVNKDDPTNKKLTHAREQLVAEALDGAVDDEMVTRFMLYTKLGAELTSEE